ncbi:MAG TPA: prepilin-type N-terminal cleavage/methylation domain-containing protein [Thermoanaerobaculia bacterium]|nr:prepilin-type N-terminal cleavage/methylation domain-containing protein [Thermoanaerobaculia bacterium]
MRKGFSLIESIIALAILMIIAIGILPLFSSAILNNTRGSDSTQASNFAKSTAERLIAERLDVPTDLTIPGGSTLVQTDEWYSPGAFTTAGETSLGDEVWNPGPPPAASTFATINYWTRHTRITQYSLKDITNNNALVTPLDGSDLNAKLVQIEVEVDSSKQGGILGGGQRFTVRTIRGF